MGNTTKATLSGFTGTYHKVLGNEPTITIVKDGTVEDDRTIVSKVFGKTVKANLGRIGVVVTVLTVGVAIGYFTRDSLNNDCNNNSNATKILFDTISSGASHTIKVVTSSLISYVNSTMAPSTNNSTFNITSIGNDTFIGNSTSNSTIANNTYN